MFIRRGGFSLKKILAMLAGAGIVGTILGLAAPAVTTFAQTSATDRSANVSATLKRHLENQDTTFTVPYGLSQTEGAVQRTLAELPYIHELVSSVAYSSGGSATKVTVTWLQTKQQSAAVDAQIKHVLGQIVKPGMSDYDKEFVIHNWIVNHVSYDTSEQKYTPYDALRGSAVCQGIATLTYRMLTKAGISAHLVEGTAGGADHLWNEVRVGGHWYQLDVTWDDPVNKQPGTISYAYYNVTSAQLAKDHTWNHAGLPVANTSFETTVSALLKTLKDPYLSTIASATGISADLHSISATAETLRTVMQAQLNAHKAQFTIQFKGSTASATAALNQVSSAGLSGFTALRYTLSPSLTAGHTLIAVTVTYAS